MSCCPGSPVRLAELFDVDVAEVEIAGELERPVVRARRRRQVETRIRPRRSRCEEDRWRQVPLVIEGANVGFAAPRRFPRGRSFSATERSLLQDAADRAALAIRRAQLHEEEHRIAVELQRGLIPKSLPTVPGVDAGRLLRGGRHRGAGGRRLVRRVRDAGRSARHRRRRRHRPRHPARPRRWASCAR